MVGSRNFGVTFEFGDKNENVMHPPLRDEQWKRVSVTDLEILNDQRAKQMIASIKSLDKIVKNMR